MKSLSWKIGLVLGGFIFLSCFGISAANEPDKAGFQEVGDLPGGSYWSKACGVSPDGSAVVGESTLMGTTPISFETAIKMVISGQGYPKESRPMDATLWRQSGDVVSLGSLLGDFTSNAYGVSTDGSAVVGRIYSSSRLEALLWTKSEGIVSLGCLQNINDPNNLETSSVAYDISADGMIVVGAISSQSGKEPFLWTKLGGMQALGNLSGGYSWGEARGVSADGSVIVGFSSSASGVEAFHWTKSGGMVGLGDLPGGKFRSEAYAVSADGSVVVGWSMSESGGEAFRWTASDGMQGLGDLPGGNFQSWAYDVSGDGSIIVGFSVSALNSDGSEAFIWDVNNGMRSLKNVLANDYDLDMSGWRLEKATGISDDGMTVVGEGLNPRGIPKGWVATFPDSVSDLSSKLPNLTSYYHFSSYVLVVGDRDEIEKTIGFEIVDCGDPPVKWESNPAWIEIFYEDCLEAERIPELDNYWCGFLDMGGIAFVTRKATYMLALCNDLAFQIFPGYRCPKLEKHFKELGIEPD